MVEQLLKSIPPDVWKQAVYQTYINSLISWIGFVVVVVYAVLALLMLRKFEWCLDEDWQWIVLTIGGTIAIFAFMFWITTGFNFLNPEYVTYTNLVHKVAKFF